MTARRQVLVEGYGETAAETAKLVAGHGAVRFALCWTHPEYPAHGSDEPPAGTPVTWTAVAVFTGGANACARQHPRINRRHINAMRGRAVVAASAYGPDPRHAVSLACGELLVRLGGARVTYVTDPDQVIAAHLVPTPGEALLEALS